jgi:hypothetical protein
MQENLPVLFAFLYFMEFRLLNTTSNLTVVFLLQYVTL